MLNGECDNFNRVVRVGNPDKELFKQKLNELEVLATCIIGKEYLGKRKQQEQKPLGSQMSDIFEELHGGHCNGSGVSES